MPTPRFATASFVFADRVIRCAAGVKRRSLVETLRPRAFALRHSYRLRATAWWLMIVMLPLVLRLGMRFFLGGLRVLLAGSGNGDAAGIS